ncbi:MAG: carbamoyltransferase HypF [Candidatus Omnitrophota bacterium]
MNVFTPTCTIESKRRLRISVQGAVQGVGFRPFLYRLAHELELKGWTVNSPQGLVAEVEGYPQTLAIFLQRLQEEKPSRAVIQTLVTTELEPAGYQEFAIRASEETGGKTTLLLPDIATCPDCLLEIFDPNDRRYLYPFTNCTNCGPRFTIIRDLPYDRHHTAMSAFSQCPQCQAEYDDPRDRRFHAQPNACPVCGPQVELWNKAGTVLQRRQDAMLAAAQAIRDGRIAAVKGVGGFHLITDARSESAVGRLRQRKRRVEKPLAVMFPSLEAIREVCFVSDQEKTLLLSPEAPIVLLRRCPGDNFIAPSVAPRNPYLGCMLPYTPLHHILLRELGFPIVATSGNLSEEPICIDEREALARLAGIADLYLVHNRPILRHADDSVTHIAAGEELLLRRARGYAPLPYRSDFDMPSMLAVGGHLKNTAALSQGRNVFISQHIGDLDNQPSYDAFLEVIAGLKKMYGITLELAACDLHPDYLSTQYAQKTGLPLIPIQHHFAHAVSCMAENRLQGPVLAISWDGTGYGTDGTIWGGEFLTATLSDFQRAAHFRYFPLPSGEKALKEPRRAALGLLFEMMGDKAFLLTNSPALKSFSEEEIRILRTLLEKGIHAPHTCSAGRLFDAVSSLIGLRQIVSFEGQGAMELEFAIGDAASEEFYPYTIVNKSAAPMVVDWEPMAQAIITEVEQNRSTASISIKFHNTLVEIIVAIARRIQYKQIVLTGGCFQNRYLMERAVQRLQAEGFEPYRHRRIPPNDGGLSLGQAVAAYHRSRNQCV